jgi:hypothetical protein
MLSEAKPIVNYFIDLFMFCTVEHHNYYPHSMVKFFPDPVVFVDCTTNKQTNKLTFLPCNLILYRYIKKLINNSRGKYKRNECLINVCKSDTDLS